MPLKNRVNPFGQFLAVDSRGDWLGNRGILHNYPNKEIVSKWKHKPWVTCNLQFNGWKREVFGQNTYSELFFLDEATALSAGHRPCATCRRQRYNEFKSVWCKANVTSPSESELPIKQIDDQLHTERAIRGGGKVTFQMKFKDVPDGTFIGEDENSYLFWNSKLHLWSPDGYKEHSELPEGENIVTVLTPTSIVKMYTLGFKPQVKLC